MLSSKSTTLKGRSLKMSPPKGTPLSKRDCKAVTQLYKLSYRESLFYSDFTVDLNLG